MDRVSITINGKRIRVSAKTLEAYLNAAGWVMGPRDVYDLLGGSYDSRTITAARKLQERFRECAGL
jgi:hypothetical protein